MIPGWCQKVQKPCALGRRVWALRPAHLVIGPWTLGLGPGSMFKETCIFRLKVGSTRVARCACICVGFLLHPNVVYYLRFGGRVGKLKIYFAFTFRFSTPAHGVVGWQLMALTHANVLLMLRGLGFRVPLLKESSGVWCAFGQIACLVARPIVRTVGAMSRATPSPLCTCVAL